MIPRKKKENWCGFRGKTGVKIAEIWEDVFVGIKYFL